MVEFIKLEKEYKKEKTQDISATVALLSSIFKAVVVIGIAIITIPILLFTMTVDIIRLPLAILYDIYMRFLK